MTSWRGFIVLVLGLALCGLPRVLWAETPTTPTAPPTAQQLYDQAQAAFDKDDWPAAIKGLASIARPDDDGRMSHSQGVIHARLAQAYAHESMIEEAVGEAGFALKGLLPIDNTERALMWLAIGEAQRFDLAISPAIDTYQKGLQAVQEAKSPELATRADVGLALCYMTVDPGKAAQLLDAVLAAPETASGSKLLRARYLALRGRASLNLGQAREAMPFLTTAIYLSGGVRGSQVNLVQVGIRGDAAIGALLAKHEEDAREYLTFSGAGHLPSDEWTNGLGDPPVCSEAADIRPDDLVVVEFSIGPEGQVMGAAPVYASRPGALGIAFAKAVKEWRRNPERIEKLPSFWRNTVRIEMRCITRPNPRSLADPFNRATIAWLSENQVSAEDLAPHSQGYVAGNDPRLERDDLAAIPALLARLPIETDYKKVTALAERLTSALEKSKAPAAARALAMSLEPEKPSSSWNAEHVRSSASHLATMERTDPQSAATAWLTLEYAIALERNGSFKEAAPVLNRVLAYPIDVLAEHDPLRDVATLHLAALQRRAGDAGNADAKVKAAGLTRAQCMLFDVRPVATNNSVYSSDFPVDALRWGFDGYVREAFDIDATGHVENVRTIIAYPPFVFRTGAEKTVAHFRYLAPVIDGASVGCDGHVIGVHYGADY